MFYLLIKRFFDITISICLIIILLPLFVVVSFAIWIEDRGPVFAESPMRIGKDGKKFFMYKFRSMIPNAYNKLMNDSKYEKKKKESFHHSNKVPCSDELVTNVGRIIRRTDIDEIPQLLNVIKGEMSLVGPRPLYDDELVRHFKKYPQDKKIMEEILKIRPGMTGIWQVSGRNMVPLHERLNMEYNYVKHLNLVTDLKIIFKTPYVIFTRKGVYE